MPPTTGTIKRITDKGFGFIAAADGTEYFFHQSACTSTPFDSMREGEQVTFTIGQGPKGPRAENVRPAGQRSRPNWVSEGTPGLDPAGAPPTIDKTPTPAALS